MSISYASFDQIIELSKQQPDSAGANYAADKRRLLQFAQRAADSIDKYKSLTFAPRYETRYIDAWGSRVYGYKLYLDYPLLSLSSVTLADSTSLVVNTDVRLYPRQGSPGWWLQLLTSAHSWVNATDAVDHDIAITGYWGWHSDYANSAWYLSGDTCGEAVDATETTIDVTDVALAGGDGMTPRFSPGNLIRVESEYMAVIDTTAAAQDTIEVVRGIRGTTAATHVQTTPIYVYKPDPSIVRAAMLIAMFNYEQRGNWAQVTFDGIATRETATIPPDAARILDNSYRIVEFA